MSAIFRFILYHEMFDNIDSISVNYEYNNKSEIEIKIISNINQDTLLRPLSWESHPAFTYMNLYTAATLAKANNMVIDVTQNKNILVIHAILL